MDGLVRSICWPEDFARLGEHIQADAVILVAGSIDRRAGSEETNLIVNEALPIAAAWELPVRSVTVKVCEGPHDAGTLDRLAAVVAQRLGCLLRQAGRAELLAALPAGHPLGRLEAA
jgi:DNA polymerase-3 subunit alpha